jgi:uncharacterized protein
MSMRRNTTAPEAGTTTEAFVPRAELQTRRQRKASPGIAEVDALGSNIERFRRDLTSDHSAALDAIVGAPNLALAALGAVPAHEMLTPENTLTLAALDARPPRSQRTLPRQLVLIMKATRYCNLRCTYCRSWSEEPNQAMSFEVLASATRDALTAAGVGDVKFVWHGGETTLRPIEFYERALWLQERYRKPGQMIANVIQTNGTRLTDDWLDFFQRYEFGVGVSLDGPPEIHDSRRRDVAGRGTSELVRGSIERLSERGIRCGVLMVVDDDVIRAGAQRTLDYLLELRVRHVSLLNVTPEGVPTPASAEEPYLEYQTFVEYLREMFRLWYPAHVDDIAILEISDLRNMLEGRKRVSCVHGPNCVGSFFTIEPDGDIGHCDKYQQNADFCFGNILRTPLAEVTSSPRLQRAYGYTAAGLELCRSCRWYAVCQGGCPYDRYVRVTRRSSPRDERCCGLAPLLDEMSATIAQHAGTEPLGEGLHTTFTPTV